MKLKDIEREIKKTVGISDLNPMQIAVGEKEAKRIILLSPTGSGKTLAYIVALLKRISPHEAATEGLNTVIVAPSRELVRQIFDVVRPIASVFGMKTLSLYGGNPFSVEEASLRGSLPKIIVATPGRLLDHINRKTLNVENVHSVVLDEYDKILELGFHDEMERICRIVGSRRTSGVPDFVMVTSATPLCETPDFIKLAEAEILDYSEVHPTESRLRIVNVPSHSKDKLSTLGALIRSVAFKGQCIVFVNHRESTDRVGKYLEAERISSVIYHGGMDQQHREMALACFEARAAKVLVATDLAARGLDITGVETVIHYHLPIDNDVWIHRNGRTARVDRKGDVYVLTGPEETIPEFIEYENDYYPDMTLTTRINSDMSLIYFDRGKRDKLSRGDIAGFVMKQAEVPAAKVGKITVGNSYSLVAVESTFVKAVIDATRNFKVKGKKTRASIIQ